MFTLGSEYKGETVLLQHYDEQHGEPYLKYFITRATSSRGQIYKLYEKIRNKDEYKLYGTGQNPALLQERFENRK